MSTVFIHEGKNIVERSKYIPLRLTDNERNLLRILEGALEISEYTDHVDISSSMYGVFFARTNVTKKSQIIEHHLKLILAFISGLYVANNLVLGSKMVRKDSKSDFVENEQFFQNIFEIGRRYKIMNPDKMRTTYGKLMYIIQDAVTPEILPELNVHIPIKCVYHLLQTKKALHLLDDPLLIPATQCVASHNQQEIMIQIETKKKSRIELKQKYVNVTETLLTEDDLTIVLDSLSDSNSYILSNRHPVDMMIGYLKRYFHPNKKEKQFSLAIRSGDGGSCLTHDHHTQYKFVLQSLELWREIQHEMFKLWLCSDDDLLGKNSYRLVDTGQGLQRMQRAPAVGSSMNSILSTVMRRVGGWVGLSVVHLGDRDVPNALIFIDKYTQVPRILNPIVNTIERIATLVSDPLCGQFITEFGGCDYLRKIILRDFFRHGFDGSGDDGGSCVDGRLTSAWNWTSQIDKKEYYPIFLLTGFSGFDGSFKK
eukprot:TRINITY_DN4973_c0_g1_i1.p1 TRINITY_DN4973_c0_g1~~TRINITY_DN4973_c0_g1_i1.p1  ORF type:complete len:515 (+),score=103.50 TRINITY_DN4973_c0_g1_i1:102-1547(+)